jgi:hypothetical protein
MRLRTGPWALVGLFPVARKSFEAAQGADGMSDEQEIRRHERWAWLRFSIVGRLLAAPPARGQLQAEIAQLAAKEWRHPISGQPTHFSFSSIERWYYSALAAKTDPIGTLRRKRRATAGSSPPSAKNFGRSLRRNTALTGNGPISCTLKTWGFLSGNKGIWVRCLPTRVSGVICRVMA